MRNINNYYKNIIKNDFITKFNTNFCNTPCIRKIVLQINLKENSLINLITSFLSLELISHQKPTLFRNNISKKVNIKLKQGVPCRCKVTIRNTILLKFVTNLFFFNSGNNKNLIDIKFINLNYKLIKFRINSFLFFNVIEKNYFLLKKLKNIDVFITLSSKSYKESLFILKSLKIIF